MRIATMIENGLLAAHIEGRLDAHTVGQYIEAVADAVGTEVPDVALDMSGVEFMDSSALAAMVRTLKRCMVVGGSVVLIAVAEPVRMILELTRLDDIFPRVDSLDEVVPALVRAGTR